MPNMLNASYRPSIHRSTFNVSTNTTYQTTSPSGFEMLKQAVSSNAFHNSDDRPDPPKCHENTRVAVIRKIMDWVEGKINTDAFMLWLYGPAGAGKTAIARTIAELCEAQGLLLASFLFFRSDPKRNTMKPLVANIAYRVACAIPAARGRIETIIEADPLILSYSVGAQLTKLVLEPLRLLANQVYFLHAPFPRLIVIDGLDECLDKDAQTNLMRTLSSSTARYQLPLKFLIASRPEAHIKSAVGLIDQSIFSRLELNNAFKPDEDIRCFLTDKFHEIQRCHPLRSQIPVFWPSEEQIDTLVRKASGQFIYASLAARFINSACDSPTRQLDIVLELRPPIDNDLPFAELDALYTFILSCIKNIHLVLRILGVYVALGETKNRRSNDIYETEAVLGLEHGDVCTYLGALSSLLEVEEGQYDVINFHHASFVDFLYTRERSNNYYVDARKIDTLIAQTILEAFTSNASSAPQRETIERLPIDHFLPHLENSLWTVELEHALEKFSFGACMDAYLERYGDQEFQEELIKDFFYYLKANEKPELHRHHSALFLDHIMSSIGGCPSGEKFHLLSTVWFVLQEPPRSSMGHLFSPSWYRFCTTLFGFDSTDLNWDMRHYKLIRHLTEYKYSRDTPSPLRAIYGHIAETKRLVPEAILSHRLAGVAMSCMKYLRRCGPKAPTRWYHLCVWASKLKRSPWIQRRRMRVTSARRGVKVHPLVRWKLLSFSQSLRRPRQTLHSEGIQSEKFYRKAQRSYMWALDLLYRTLHEARQSDELTKALSKPFIPWPAPILFPRRVKRVRKAIDVYLEEARRGDYWSVVLGSSAGIGGLGSRSLVR